MKPRVSFSQGLFHGAVAHVVIDGSAVARYVLGFDGTWTCGVAARFVSKDDVQAYKLLVVDAWNKHLLDMVTSEATP